MKPDTVRLLHKMQSTAAKDAFEDFGKHRSDKRENGRKATVVRSGEKLIVNWSEVREGDVVEVRKNEWIPADLILLTGNADDICFIETKNLDGETNLKLKEVREHFFHPDLFRFFFFCLPELLDD
jgi:P-type E1-E2 ATPase